MNEGNENYFTVKERRICAYTYENGDYCGMSWEHEGPCWEPWEV